MNVRSIIALFLGLLMQFSQVPSRAVDQPIQSCATQGEFMACCAGLEACPCAKESDQNQKPAPAIPAGVDLKMVIAKYSGTHGADALVLRPLETALITDSQTESRSGYAGVPLSVAFCTFVI